VYAPPSEAARGAGVNEPEAGAHRDALASGYQARSLVLRVLCGLLIVNALLLGLNFGACALTALAPLAADQLDALTWFSQALVKVHPAFQWVRVFFFAWFLVGSNKNARAFVRASWAADVAGSEELADEEEDEDRRERVRRPVLFGFSPASMVWWFLVPIFNLFKPYSAVKAVWNASLPSSNRAQNESAAVIWQWWLAYLLTLLFPIRRAVLLLATRVPFSNQNLFAALQNLAGCAAALFTLRMVQALHQRQRLRAAELWPAQNEPRMPSQPLNESPAP